MLKAIIIDDEDHARNLLEHLLTENCPEVQVLERCEDGIRGLQAIHKHKPDVVFLDIQMQPMQGFEMLKCLPSIDFSVVFVTAFSEFATQAFEVSAVDFLTKPVLKDRLRQAVDRVLTQQEHRLSRAQLDALVDNMQPASLNRRLGLPSPHGGWDFIPLSEIMYLEAAGKHTIFYLTGGRIVNAVNENLGKFEKRLKGESFYRVHDSYIANTDHIEHFDTGENGGSVRMSNQKRLPVARLRREELLRLLGLKK